MHITLPNIYFYLRLLCYGLIVIVFPANQSYAQYENVWIFGINAGVDFNSTLPTPLKSNLADNPRRLWGEASASVCDADGNLLFYTEGSRVIDREHNLMPNGDSLVPIPNMYFSWSPTTSTSQGTIIIPIPDQPDRYYVFSLTQWENTMRSYNGKLFYSIVDMSLNGGLGDVITKGMFLDSNLTERMTGVVGDHCNVWLLTITQSNELKAYEITSDSISTRPVISNITNMNPMPYIGFLAPSPDRRKIAISGTENGNPGLLLCDFDPASGRISNERLLDNAPGYGICFSPDNTKLYFNQTWKRVDETGIYQFNLAAGNLSNIINSKTLIAESVTGPNLNTHIKLAPDSKVYFQGDMYIPGSWGNFSLSAINLPNQLGLACQPQRNVISFVPLNTTMAIGLPSVVPVIPYDTIGYKKYLELCDKSSIELIPEVISGWRYLWNDGVGDTIRTVAKAGTYRVSYYSDCMKYHTDTFEVSVLPVSHNSFTDIMCSHESYDFNGRELNSPGKYYDTLLSANGCDSIITLDLVALPPPEVGISVKAEIPLCIGDTVLCVATGASRYQWYSNNQLVGNNSREYIYLPYLSNKVFVIGQSDNGCRDTAEVVINVDACCELFIPNAFSPNGDGINDGFAPIPHGHINNYNMQIFNRWGEKVFSSFALNNSWDGTFKGIPVDVGVYFYYITAECLEGSEIVRKGDVLLVR